MTINDIELQLKIIKATIADYPTVQNMARFYVYDMSRSCGFISDEWACPSDGLYESYDFKLYFDNPQRQAFLIKIHNELAGFVLLNKEGTQHNMDWNMGEFFILAKFQGIGLGSRAAHEIWKTHPGIWEISVIPENKPALMFWRKAISTFTAGNYTEEIKAIKKDSHQFERCILSFNTHSHSSINKTDDFG